MVLVMYLNAMPKVTIFSTLGLEISYNTEKNLGVDVLI